MSNIIAHLTATVRNFIGTGRSALDVAIVDGSGNQITSIGGTGGTSATDESAFTAGAGTGTPAMGLFESSPTSVANNQVGVLGMTADRKLKISGSFSSSPTTSATSAYTRTAASAASVNVLAANAARLAFTLYNDSTAACYVKLGTTASATSFFKRLLPGEYLSTQDVGVNWTGAIDAIWDSATGNMEATELTA